MKSYEVRLTKAAEKSILKIHKALPSIAGKLSRYIDQLSHNPHLGPKLSGADGEVRRIRVGDYRLVYEVFENHLLILVVYIGPRGDAYKKS